MKAKNKTINFLIIAILLLLINCKGVDVKKTASVPDVPVNTPAVLADNFVGSNYKGNFVWGIAMNFAWNELENSILHDKLKLASSDKTVKQIENAFNTFSHSKNVLDNKSYYTKAGYGPKTLKLINKEVREKFPKKSFQDLDIKLNEYDIISYAYFIKAVEYLYEFDAYQFNFMGTKVNGFYANTNEQREVINIIKYETDDKFIISLTLKNSNDCLLLAKGYDMKNPKQVLDVIKKEKSDNYEILLESDNFYAPNINLNYKRVYQELLGQPVANKNFESYIIGQMFENIKFKMDRKGAKVENEAVISMLLTTSMPQPPRNFILDKPYWIVMKRAEADMPYFLLGVNNTELMEKVLK